MAALVTVRFDARDLRVLADPLLIAQAEAQMIERGIEILVPLARAEAPVRTGRGRSQIAGTVDRRGGHPFGRVHTGKAFQLRILATGAKPHGINVFRYKSKTKARRAARALGPGGARGAVQALRFSVGGAMLFRGAVQHPGLAPDPWLDRAAQQGEAAVGHAAEVVVQAALDKATHA